jgi:hypothetical protein
MKGPKSNFIATSLKHLTMKKSNFISRFVLILGLASTQVSFGQRATNANINSNSLSESLKPDMSNENADRKAFENLKAVNVKIHKDFIKHFSSASNITTSTDKEYTSIACIVDGVKTRVNYFRNGRWASTLRMLQPKQIPARLYDDVSAAYPGYKLTSGKEVIVGPKVAYLVDIENDRAFKTIRIIDGEYDIYQEFNKQ